HQQEARLDDSGLARLNEDQMQPVDNARLDLGRAQDAVAKARATEADVRARVEVARILRGLSANKRLRLETSVAPEVANAVIDPARLKQVLYNFLSNAIKFTPEEGRVTVAILPEGPNLFRLMVEDTGIGIS